MLHFVFLTEPCKLCSCYALIYNMCVSVERPYKVIEWTLGFLVWTMWLSELIKWTLFSVTSLSSVSVSVICNNVNGNK